jgi:hypothetical protein
MAGPILYSTNPWIAHQIAMNYRGGIHYVWCSEEYDPTAAGGMTAAAAIAPSSSPMELYVQLKAACDREDSHSHLIKGYRKTFRRLAAEWLAAGEITGDQRDEIVATVNAPSWRIWRPQVYVIPRAPIEAAGRLISVPRKHRAAYGLELQICDLREHEFDIMNRPPT